MKSEDPSVLCQLVSRLSSSSLTELVDSADGGRWFPSEYRETNPLPS